MSRESMRKLVLYDLNMTPYKLKKRQLLSSKTRDKRVLRSRKLLRILRSGTVGSVLWTDEKIFKLELPHNRQNDRVLSTDLSKTPEHHKIVSRCQHPVQVMVWAGVTSCGLKTPLIFIEEGVKVNQHVYKKMLSDQVLPWMVSQNFEGGCAFQQDGAPSHTAKMVQKWCEANFNSFWPKDFWPPSSPDLNPMDYSI